MSRRHTVALIIVCIALGGVFLLKGGPQREAGVPRLALNLPITGPFAIYGQTVRDGALFAADDLRSKGQAVDLAIDDNGGTTSGSISVFQKQSLAPIDIYSSGVKPQTMAIFDRVIEAGYPYFVWVFDAFITDRHPTVFRTWVNYKYEPSKYLQFIECRKARRVAIACVNLPHALQEFDEILIPELRERGIEVAIEHFDFNTTQHREIIAKLAAAKPDVFILNGFQENLVGFVRALRTLEVFHDNAIGTFDLLDAANALRSEELDGFRVVAPSFLVRETTVWRQWKNRFAARFRRPPLYTDAYSYDMVQIIANAQRRADPQSSAEWTKALLDTDLAGVTGRLRFDDGRDLQVDLKIGAYREGKLSLDGCEDRA